MLELGGFTRDNEFNKLILYSGQLFLFLLWEVEILVSCVEGSMEAQVKLLLEWVKLLKDFPSKDL